MFYHDERLALFIDGANLHATGKALGFDIDYRLLRQEFTQPYQSHYVVFLVH